MNTSLLFILTFGENHILPFFLGGLDIIFRKLCRLRFDTCIINFSMPPVKQNEYYTMNFKFILVTYLAILSICFLIRGTILDSFVFSSKSFRRLRCARYFCSYAVCEKATETCSPLTHSSRLFSIQTQNPLAMNLKRNINVRTYNCQDKGNG